MSSMWFGLGVLRRAQGIHRYEFYESYEVPLELSELREVVRGWEYVCQAIHERGRLSKELWLRKDSGRHRDAVRGGENGSIF